MKLQEVREVAFTAHDQHGDFVCVHIKGDNAAQIVQFLQAAIINAQGSGLKLEK